MKLFVNFILFFNLLTIINVYGQKERALIRKGNENFYQNKIEKAEELYKEGLKENKDSYEAAFNLGDTYYKKKDYEKATQTFTELSQKNISPENKAKVFHNLGNSLLQQRKFEESIRAYKNALKNNPRDEDTRYNLAYAQTMLKQQQDQQDKKQDQNKDQKDNKDKQDEKEKQQKKEDQQKQENSKENQDKQGEEENKQQKPQQPEMSKEEAKRILEALKNQEKEAQDKMRKQKGKAVNIEIEKDW